MRRIACALASLLVAACFCGTAQATPFSVTLGGARTTLQEAALAYAASYLPFLAESVTGHIQPRSFGYTKWEPELSLASGGKDAMNHLIARADFTACFVPDTVIEGIPWPKMDGMMHDILLSGGLETTDQLDVLAIVAELGYVPWFPKDFRWIRTGVFFQAGYQTHLNAPDTTAGLPQDGTVVRIHGRLRAEERFPKNGPRAFGIAATGDAWYDVMHSQLYYSLQGTLRFFFAKDKSVDVSYERNSGAPTFSTGNQLGLGATFQLGQ